jgi:hypothetical protein
VYFPQVDFATDQFTRAGKADFRKSGLCKDVRARADCSCVSKTAGRSTRMGDTSPAGSLLGQKKGVHEVRREERVTKLTKRNSSLGFLPTFRCALAEGTLNEKTEGKVLREKQGGGGATEGGIHGQLGRTSLKRWAIDRVVGEWLLGLRGSGV